MANLALFPSVDVFDAAPTSCEDSSSGAVSSHNTSDHHQQFQPTSWPPMESTQINTPTGDIDSDHDDDDIEEFGGDGVASPPSQPRPCTGSRGADKDDEREERRKRLASMKLNHQESVKSLGSLHHSSHHDRKDGNNGSKSGSFSGILGSFLESNHNKSSTSINKQQYDEMSKSSNHSTGSKKGRNSFARIFKKKGNKKACDLAGKDDDDLISDLLSTATDAELDEIKARISAPATSFGRKRELSPICRPRRNQSLHDKSSGAARDLTVLDDNGGITPLERSPRDGTGRVRRQKGRSPTRGSVRRTRSGSAAASARSDGPGEDNGTGMVRPHPLGVKRSQTDTAVTTRTAASQSPPSGEQDEQQEEEAVEARPDGGSDTTTPPRVNRTSSGSGHRRSVRRTSSASRASASRSCSSNPQLKRSATTNTPPSTRRSRSPKEAPLRRAATASGTTKKRDDSPKPGVGGTASSGSGDSKNGSSSPVCHKKKKNRDDPSDDAPLRRNASGDGRTAKQRASRTTSGSTKRRSVQRTVSGDCDATGQRARRTTPALRRSATDEPTRRRRNRTRTDSVGVAEMRAMLGYE